MRLFVDDMSSIGQSLDKAQDNYRQAMKKLSSGRGNLLAQAEAFRGLGVEIKREINPELTAQAQEQDEEFRLRSGQNDSLDCFEDNALDSMAAGDEPESKASSGG